MSTALTANVEVFKDAALALPMSARAYLAEALLESLEHSDEDLAAMPVAEDALAAVPRSYREASYALGANRWETALRIVVPAALPGIFAGVALGFGRAVGETMIVLMASGNAALTSWSITDSVRTLSATIAAELGEVVFGGPHYRVLFLLGVLLFVFTFAVNLAGELTVRRLKRTLGGRS